MFFYLHASFLQWGAVDAEIKVPSDENTELKGSPFNAWSRSIAMYAMPTAKDFFLANFYPSGPFTCIFSKTSPEFFVPVWARRKKKGHPAGCGFPC